MTGLRGPTEPPAAPVASGGRSITMPATTSRRLPFSVLPAALLLVLCPIATASAQQPTSELLLPHFSVATDNPDGLTTLFAVRNETSVQQPVVADFFDAFGTLHATVELSIAPRQVESFNIRDVAGLPLDIDDVARGYVVVSPGDGADALELSGDWFSVTADEDFATGHTLVDLSETSEALCIAWSSRFFYGGPFTGGTILTFWVENPQGVELTDPPTVVGTAYDEDGVELGSFEVRTAFKSFQMAANGAAFSAPFGTVDLNFNNTRGVVFTDHSASGRFSVGFQATCTDPGILSP
jgi:hypothetical protein